MARLLQFLRWTKDQVAFWESMAAALSKAIDTETTVIAYEGYIREHLERQYKLSPDFPPEPTPPPEPQALDLERGKWIQDRTGDLKRIK